jgi:hypothetical protein
MAEEPDGVELVYNGGFDEGVDGWLDSSIGTGSISASDSKLLLSSYGTSDIGITDQAISTVVGGKYTLSLTITSTTGSYNSIKLGTSQNGSQYTALNNLGVGIHTYTFVATSATLWIRFNGYYGTGTTTIDNISVQRLSSPLMQCFERSETDGVELVTNGTFDTDSDWVKGTGWSIRGGKATHTSPDYGELSQDISLESGKTYIATFNYIYSSGGGMGFGEVGQTSVFTATASGFYSIKFVSTGATGIRFTGDSVNGSVDNISVQKLKPATCTVAAEVTMGASAEDIPSGSVYHGILTSSDTILSTLYFGKNFDGTIRYSATSADGTSVRSTSGINWSRNERHIKIVQTNADGTQFRVGNKRIGIDSAIQWSAWTNFDGSFNPLTALRLAYGNTVPIWFRRVMVSNKGGMSDTEIETRMVA